VLKEEGDAEALDVGEGFVERQDRHLPIDHEELDGQHVGDARSTPAAPYSSAEARKAVASGSSACAAWYLARRGTPRARAAR